MKGRWRYYNFSSLAQKTLSVITVEPTIPALVDGASATRAQERSQPDAVVVLDTEDSVTYVGHGQMTRVFLPTVMR